MAGDWAQYANGYKLAADQISKSNGISLSHFKTMMEANRNGLGYIEAGIEIEIQGRTLDADLQAEISSYD